MAKSSNTYKSQDQAKRTVASTLQWARKYVRDHNTPTVPGWLNRLEGWLVREERGNMHDARTPYFKRLAYSAIATIMINIVKDKRLALTKEYRTVPSFYASFLAVEEHQAELISGRGIFPPASEWMYEKAKEVFSDKPPRKELNQGAMNRSLEWLTNMVPSGLLDIDEDRDFREAFHDAGTDAAKNTALNVATNSCFATYVKHWFHSVWDKSVSLHQKLVQRLLQVEAKRLLHWMLTEATGDETLEFVATANQRTNVGSGFKLTEKNTYKGKYHSKLRFVCAMPKLDTIIGKILLNKLLPTVVEYFKNPDGTRMFTALTTPERIDKNFETALQNAHKAGINLLGTDFSGYDATVPPWLIMRVMEAIKPWFSPRAQKVLAILVRSATYGTYCLLTNTVLEKQPSSIKSGSWMTNIFDSLINLVSQRYGLEAGFYKSILWQFVQGDDAVLGGLGVNPKTFVAAVTPIGFVANEEKQYWEPDSVSFCQKIYVRGYPGGIYPISRATASCVSLEDDVPIETGDEQSQFPYVLIYRTLCRLNNAMFNPCFVELVNLYKREDKLHLGANLPAEQVAHLAGEYAVRMRQESLDKPWKSPGRVNALKGFGSFPVNRVLRGELPPPPGVARWEWCLQEKWSSVTL